MNTLRPHYDSIEWKTYTPFMNPYPISGGAHPIYGSTPWDHTPCSSLDPNYQGSVVQRVDNAVQRINHYPSFCVIIQVSVVLFDGDSHQMITRWTTDTPSV